MVVAHRRCGDAEVLEHVATSTPGILLVEGKRSDVFRLPDGHRMTGQDWLTRNDWPWHDSAPLLGCRYARLTATSPSDGRVTVVIVAQSGRDRSALLCRETTMTAPLE